MKRHLLMIMIIISLKLVAFLGIAYAAPIITVNAMVKSGYIIVSGSTSDSSELKILYMNIVDSNKVASHFVEKQISGKEWVINEKIPINDVVPGNFRLDVTVMGVSGSTKSRVDLTIPSSALSPSSASPQPTQPKPTTQTQSSPAPAPIPSPPTLTLSAAYRSGSIDVTGSAKDAKGLTALDVYLLDSKNVASNNRTINLSGTSYLISQKFSVGNLPPGQYTVRAGLRGSSGSVTERAMVTIPSSPVQNPPTQSPLTTLVPVATQKSSATIFPASAIKKPQRTFIAAPPPGLKGLNMGSYVSVSAPNTIRNGSSGEIVVQLSGWDQSTSTNITHAYPFRDVYYELGKFMVTVPDNRTVVDYKNISYEYCINRIWKPFKSHASKKPGPIAKSFKWLLEWNPVFGAMIHSAEGALLLESLSERAPSLSGPRDPRFRDQNQSDIVEVSWYSPVDASLPNNTSVVVAVGNRHSVDKKVNNPQVLLKLRIRIPVRAEGGDISQNNFIVYGVYEESASVDATLDDTRAHTTLRSIREFEVAPVTEDVHPVCDP